MSSERELALVRTISQNAVVDAVGAPAAAPRASDFSVPAPTYVMAGSAGSAGSASLADVSEAINPLGAMSASATRVLASSAKSHPGREIFRAGSSDRVATGTATGSDTQVTTNAPTPRDSASLAAARGAADAAAPPHRVPAGFAGTQKMGRPKKNNVQTESRVKATVEEAVAPLRQQISSLHEVIAAQHAEMLKAIATGSSASSSDPPTAGFLLTSSGNLNYGATPAAPPEDVQTNVERAGPRATFPSLRATPVLDC